MPLVRVVGVQSSGAKEQLVADPEWQSEGGGAVPLTVVRSQPTAAFDELYRAEWSGLVALGWSLTGRWSVAEELVQDAFADAYRSWDRVGGLDRPGAWLRRAVVNRSASHHRHRSVEDRGLARLDAREGAGAGSDPTGDGAAERIGDPAFWAAVRALPERQAACVALHYLEDRSVAEIAEVLDCRAATVKVHLHRGRTALARSLAALDDRADRPDPTDRRTPDDLEEEAR